MSNYTARAFGLSPVQKFLKRGFDLILSSFGLLGVFWIIAIAWVFATLDTKANGFFTQRRVGRHGRPFTVLKIRTMRPHSESLSTVTTDADPRVTRLGRFWRKTKIDELPQLLNVLLGQMSFVGPRPDVPGFADCLQGEDRIILDLRPGITGPATLAYKNEETLLATVSDPERYNREVIYPDKVRINREYVQNWSFWQDIRYILQTLRIHR
ncbi:MAG: sugar transferase [Desulforhopalus sp.]|nr:sugar transferase [Desulforhopalus sp.]